MLRQIRPQPSVDVRELITQAESTESAHFGGSRDPNVIEALYRVDETLVNPPIKQIAIVDDVLTTGGHFQAAKSILNKRFPDTKIRRLFIARTARDST